MPYNLARQNIPNVMLLGHCTQAPQVVYCCSRGGAHCSTEVEGYEPFLEVLPHRLLQGGSLQSPLICLLCLQGSQVGHPSYHGSFLHAAVCLGTRTMQGVSAVGVCSSLVDTACIFVLCCLQTVVIKAPAEFQSLVAAATIDCQYRTIQLILRPPCSSPVFHQQHMVGQVNIVLSHLSVELLDPWLGTVLSPCVCLGMCLAPINKRLCISKPMSSKNRPLPQCTT